MNSLGIADRFQFQVLSSTIGSQQTDGWSVQYIVFSLCIRIGQMEGMALIFVGVSQRNLSVGRYLLLVAGEQGAAQQ